MRPSDRHLPHMLLATTIVAVVPFSVSLALRATGVISSPWLAVALAVALSLGASTAGSAYWRKHGTAGELLFSELLLWGWIRRARQERALANTTRLLGLAWANRPESLPVTQKGQVMRQMAEALEGKDMYLNGHSRRVARHAAMIAGGMGLRSEEVARIRAAAAVHDIGKLHTPKSILNKPGRLTDAEFDVIKRHPVDGADIVAVLGDPELTRIVRHHHERLDGAGYPDGLAGEQIPLGARIIAVADTFDAITSVRPYRAAARHQKAIDILRREAGSQLDPDAVRAFLAYYSGNRPTAVWATAISTLRRLIAWLSGDPAAAATLSAGKLAAAVAATAAIGVAAGAAPVPVAHVSNTSAVAAAHPSSGAANRSVPAATRSTPAPTSHGSHLVPLSAGATRSRSAHGRTIRTRPPQRPAAVAPGQSSHGQAAQPTGTSRAPASGLASPTTSTVSNSAAGGAASRPTSTNPAGHVNHASSTGNAARNGQPPHATAPGHSRSSNGGGDTNGNGHSQVNPPTPAGASTGGQGTAQGAGNGSAQGAGNANSNTQGAGNAHGNATANAQAATPGQSSGRETANAKGH
jgi:response regulator RpfG family c-di-GMP phosphodiesterase